MIAKFPKKLIPLLCFISYFLMFYGCQASEDGIGANNGNVTGMELGTKDSPEEEEDTDGDDSVFSDGGSDQGSSDEEDDEEDASEEFDSESSEGSYDGDEDLDEQGMDWDEMEQEARREDRERGYGTDEEAPRKKRR